MDGKETVLMFVNDVISSVLTPTKQLKGFEKVFIKSGETVTVNLKLNIKDLAIVTRDLEYIVEKGKFEIMVGRNTKEYLKDILKKYEIEKIELIGVCTDICVISNALLLKANFPEIPLYVDSSCCAGSSLDAHEAALKVLKSCQIIVC